MDQLHLLFIVLLLLFTATLAGYLARHVTRFHTSPGAWPLVALLLAASVWSIGYAFELASADLTIKLFWAKVQYLGIVTVAPSWFVFAIQYAAQQSRFTHIRRDLSLLAIVPILTLFLAWTNDVHGLIWSQTGLDDSGPSLALEYGTGFWIHWVYSYVLLFFGSIGLIAMLLRSSPIYRRQAGVALLGVLIPWAGNALFVSGLSPVPGLDLTPFAFTIAGLAFGWSLFRLHLLDIVPIARRAVMDGLDDCVIALDPQNRIVDLNPAAERLIGSHAAEMIGRPTTKALGDCADLVMQCRDMDVVQVEITLGEGNAKRYYDLRISPLTDERDHCIGRLVLLHNVTSHKWAEAELRTAKDELALKVHQRTESLSRANEQLRHELAKRERAERKFRMLLESTPDAMVIVDEDAQIVLVNAQTERLFGYARDELLQKHVKILLAERFRGKHLETLARNVRDPHAWPMAVGQELYGLHRDGSEFPIEISLSPLETEEGLLVSSAIRDISERVRAEAALRDSEQTYRSLFEHANDAILLISLDGVHLRVNQKAAELLGYERDELVGMSLQEIIVPREYKDSQGKLEALRAGQSLPVYERRLRNNEGGEIPVEVNVALLRDAEGNPKLIQSVIRDISERKRTEKALQHLAEQRKRLLEVTHSMLAISSLDDAIDQIMQALREILTYDSCGLYWVDEEAGALRPYRIMGKEKTSETLDDWIIPLGQGIAGDVARSGVGELVNDAHLDPRSVYPRDVAVEREHLISIPIKIQEETMGIYHVSRVSDRPFTTEEFELVELFVAQAAIAIQNAQLYTEVGQHAEEVKQRREQLRALTRRLAAAQEAERKELARELHDQVGQSLSALDFHLNIIRSQVLGSSPQCDQIRSHVDASLALLSNTAERVRDVMANLRPPVLDDHGLVAALDWYGTEFVVPWGINIAVRGCEPAPRLDPPVELALFRIAQEALTNAIKYSQAKQVTVSVETDLDRDVVRMAVADEGIGFERKDRTGPTDRQSWGLITMVERAEAVGGHCEIESHPYQGTQVIVEVPR
jgi:PAS domain S-box-containing protein